MFSKTCEYGIKAIIFLAQNRAAGKMKAKDIAEAIKAPEQFIAKILQELARKKIVYSAKGPTGGFYLNDDVIDKSIAEVVLSIDGNGIFSDCVLGLTHCSDKNPCPLHSDYTKIRKGIIDMLEKKTFRSFVSN